MSTDSKPIRILTADDHALLRHGLASLVGAALEISAALIGRARRRFERQRGKALD